MTAWLAALAGMGMLTGQEGPCSPELFRVTRSTNANVVVYEAHLAAAASLDPEEPVRPVWLMLAEDGRREDLDVLEIALAYGVDVRRGASQGTFVVSLRAHPGFPVWVAVEGGCPVARVRIHGREAVLRVVAVEASGGLLPRVEHVDVVGIDRATGAEVRERLLPSG